MLSTAIPHWNASGMEVEILSTGVGTGPFTDVLRAQGCTIHHIPFARSLGFLRAVYRFLKQRQFDVVHIQTERANFWYALLSRWSGPCAILRTINSVFPYSGLLRLRRTVQRRLMTRLLGVEMIAVSRAVQDVEAACFGNSARLFPGWFDSDRFRPPSAAERTAARRAFRIEDGATVIASVGNCAAVKNHSAIIHALTEVPLVQYLHAGQEDATRSERQLAASLGLSDRVQFLGAMRDVRPVLYAADAFVMPSTYEGLGIAAIEAMGTGLPCVLSDVAGLREFKQCEGVIWVEPQAESIAAALRLFCSMPPAIRARTGRDLSASVHPHFAAPSAAQAYARLYSNVLLTRKRSGGFMPLESRP